MTPPPQYKTIENASYRNLDCSSIWFRDTFKYISGDQVWFKGKSADKWKILKLWSELLQCFCFSAVAIFLPARVSTLTRQMPVPCSQFLFPVFLFLCCSLLLQCFSLPECLLWHDRCALTDPQFPRSLLHITLTPSHKIFTYSTQWIACPDCENEKLLW